MSGPIDFYFDFASPYGYFAAGAIDALGARYQRTVNWHAIVLDANFQSLERIRIPSSVMRSDYIRRDVERVASFMKLPYKAPSSLGLHTELAARLFYWFNDRDPQQSRAFAQAVFKAYFVEDRNIAQLEVLQQLCCPLQMTPDDVASVAGDSATRARLKAEIDMAEARGVFGSPFFIVEGERFWGNDRLPLLERWLDAGTY
ncbi:2-hydroxychromene-2-carboxylate isomerase [Roseateles violae]|uniref:2-hydroxychromene-2-carboxylate isomerase n=1 Tax=Roseateles violae TaxID=3058042 RepID=A0ABT8DZR6_9BURK|nr:2-hydroxychromene-2-carboxylate isomerase [Pelomonas sp. PFR6]MDN3923087.1 2-hydroxychromene-2-carboxylate isomerase [Pelomonas sp. PFR6]